MRSGIGAVWINNSALHNHAWVFDVSAFTMISTENPVYISGVWGPCYSTMVLGMWLSEGSQSVAGAAIEQSTTFRSVFGKAEAQAQTLNVLLPAYLADLALSKITDLFRAIELV